MLQLGAEGWKPVWTALLLPPVPLLVLMLLGMTLARRRPGWAWLLWLAGAAGIWLGSTSVVGDALQAALRGDMHALDQRAVQQLRGSLPTAANKPATAIVVLGAGRESHAPEYSAGNLSEPSMERLRYGLWLARETGAPVAYSGGVGHAQPGTVSEAEIAAQIAARDFGIPLTWLEGESRDTRENAARSVALMRGAGITRIVLVTHGWHMRRSLRAFEQATAQHGGGIALVAAPMGLADDETRPVLRWLPSSTGFRDTRSALREMLGLVFGA
jgi:uncharacterized SAM-binding protein YcdF (DUF218 family)